MIRMGRGSKNDTPDTTPVQNYTTPTTSTPTYSYQSETAAAPSRAVTDSESMARALEFSPFTLLCKGCDPTLFLRTVSDLIHGRRAARAVVVASQARSSSHYEQLAAGS